MHQQDRYTQAKKVTLIGAAINALLGIVKVTGGMFFYSHALVADGLHSFSDLVTDGMVLFASKYGSQDADDTHPYGHQRIETAATLLLALMLILVGLGIAWDSLEGILYRHQYVPNRLALPVAILSILANEGLFHYTQRVGKDIDSDLIIANAWHHRSDAGSSVIVAVGLFGSMAGFHFLDGIAAIIVGLLIIKMGWSYGWNSVKELVDTAVEPQLIKSMEQIILNVDGVKKIHQLRTRTMGRDIYIDLHILVNPFISVSEGHFIAQHVHHALMEQVEGVNDVTVHVDPEDDEVSSPSLHLPNRKTLETNLLQPWQQANPEIRSWVIHYLNGNLIIDLMGDQNLSQIQELQNRIQTDLHLLSQTTRIRIFTQQNEIRTSKIWPRPL